MVYILAEERGLPFCPGGSVTLKLRKALKGIEPDQCFWIANAAQVEKLPKLDLRIHPPPDLAIEVDVWNSSLNRFRIYARLRIPELWRLDGNDLRFHQLCGKKYMEIAESAAFPGLVAGELLPFIIRARESSPFISVMQAFRAWVKEHIAKQSPPPQ
jgi:Uma2 family endonuclease